MNKIYIIIFIVFTLSCSTVESTRQNTTNVTNISQNTQNQNIHKPNSRENLTNSNTENNQNSNSIIQRPVTNLFNEQNILIVTPRKNRIDLISPDGNILKSFSTGAPLLSTSWSSHTSCATFLTKSNSQSVIAIFNFKNNFKYEFKGKNLSNPNISKMGNFICYSSITNGIFKLNLFTIENRENKVIFSLPISNITPGLIISKSTPAISSNENLIAFSAFKNENFDIFIYNINTGIIRNLTRRQTDEYSPVFSPNNRYIAYISKKTTPQIFIMRVDGRGRKRLTFGPDAKQSLSFSPDGNKIVFISQYKNKSFIYLMDKDGDNLTKIKKIRHRIYNCRFYNKKIVLFKMSRGIYSLNLSTKEIRKIHKNRHSYFSISER